MGNNGVMLMDVTKSEWDKLKSDVNEICVILKGKPKAKMPGLIDRVAENERIIEEMDRERQRRNSWIKGFGIGLGLNLLATIATLIAVTQALSGGG